MLEALPCLPAWRKRSSTLPMTPRALLADTLSPLVDLIYPPRCPACGAGLASQVGLCADCWDQLVIPSAPSCGTCQRPFGESGPEDGAICAPCLARPPKHDGIAAATLYNDVSRKLVLALKHGGRIALAPMLARLMAARLPPATGERLIIPVPLHRWRLWQRGFNQAALLAREIERLGHGRLMVDGLIRTRRTPSLGGMGAKARRRVLSGAVTVNPRHAARLRGRHVVLVDDVLTSGATSGVCVAALKKAGAASVTICCFARVLDEAIDLRATSQSETPGSTKDPGAT